MYSRKHEPTASHLQAPGGRLGFSFPKWLLNIATHHTERHVGTGLPAPDQAWASLLRSISWLLGFSTGVQDDHIVCHYWGLCSERVSAVLMALLAKERRCAPSLPPPLWEVLCAVGMADFQGLLGSLHSTAAIRCLALHTSRSQCGVREEDRPSVLRQR